MIVAACEMDLRLLGDNRSLKDKRRVILSLKDKLKKRFNASVAEVGAHELWQRSLIGVACVTGEMEEAKSMIDGIRNFVDGIGELEMIHADVRYY